LGGWNRMAEIGPKSQKSEGLIKRAGVR